MLATMSRSDAISPRVLREEWKSLQGKRVTCGLTNYHYVSGDWTGLDKRDAEFVVGERRFRIPIAEIATLSGAPAWQAPYYK